MRNTFAPEMQVKQFVAVVQSKTGQKFMVFETGDAKFYLFNPVDSNGCLGTNQFPVRKKDLRDDIRRALRHGYGNAIL